MEGRYQRFARLEIDVPTYLGRQTLDDQERKQPASSEISPLTLLFWEVAAISSSSSFLMEILVGLGGVKTPTASIITHIVSNPHMDAWV